MRRSNDAFKENSRDKLFAAEVKRIARVRELTLRALASRVDLHHSVVVRHLSGLRKKTQQKTAIRYARALEVPEPYLRLLANRNLTYDDARPAFESLRRLYDESQPILEPSRAAHLWGLLREKIIDGIDDAESLAREALVRAHLGVLRREVDAACGIDEQEESLPLLQYAAAAIGVDISAYVKAVSDNALGDYWLVLPSAISERDRDRLVKPYRELLRSLNLYRPAMEEKLKLAKSGVHGLRDFLGLKPLTVNSVPGIKA